MSTPLISVPTEKPQPDLAAYGLSELNLFTQFDRAALARGGYEDAPDFNPAYPVKSWVETDDQGNPITDPRVYLYVDPKTGHPAPMILYQPGRFNLPGLKSYEPYVIEPSEVMLVYPPPTTLTPCTINPNQLCLEAEVAELAGVWEQWDVDCDYVEALMDPWKYVYPDDEPRRVWNIIFKRVPFCAALFVQAQNAAGIGAPGYWDYPGPATGYLNPEWISTKPTSVPEPTGSPIPVPQRRLYDNEAITVGMMAQYQISRTDLAGATDAA